MIYSGIRNDFYKISNYLLFLYKRCFVQKLFCYNAISKCRDSVSDSVESVF